MKEEHSNGQTTSNNNSAQNKLDGSGSNQLVHCTEELVLTGSQPSNHPRAAKPSADNGIQIEPEPVAEGSSIEQGKAADTSSNQSAGQEQNDQRKGSVSCLVL